MANREVGLEIPRPEETAAETARIAYIAWAVDQVPLLTMGTWTDKDQSETVLAERFLPGDTLNDDGYEELVLTALSDLLPRVKKLPEPRPVKQSDKLANFIEKHEELAVVHSLSRKLPNRTFEKKKALRAAAVTTGLGRTALAVHPSKGSRRLVWPAGVRGAASLFRADIHKEFDRRIYDDEDQILTLLEGYMKKLRLPELEDGELQRWGYYEVINRRDREPITLAGRRGTPFSLFWRQLHNDLQKLTASQ